jgi:hypothetical protein
MVSIHFLFFLICLTCIFYQSFNSALHIFQQLSIYYLRTVLQLGLFALFGLVVVCCSLT